MKVKVLKIDVCQTKVKVVLNEILDVDLRSWNKPGTHCVVIKDGKRFWYKKKYLITISDLRDSNLQIIGI